MSENVDAIDIKLVYILQKKEETMQIIKSKHTIVKWEIKKYIWHCSPDTPK